MPYIYIYIYIYMIEIFPSYLTLCDGQYMVLCTVAPKYNFSSLHQLFSSPHHFFSSLHQLLSSLHQLFSSLHQLFSSLHQLFSSPWQRDMATHNKDNSKDIVYVSPMLRSLLCPSILPWRHSDGPWSPDNARSSGPRIFSALHSGHCRRERLKAQNERGYREEKKWCREEKKWCREEKKVVQKRKKEGAEKRKKGVQRREIVLWGHCNYVILCVDCAALSLSKIGRIYRIKALKNTASLMV